MGRAAARKSFLLLRMFGVLAGFGGKGLKLNLYISKGTPGTTEPLENQMLCVFVGFWLDFEENYWILKGIQEKLVNH